VVFLTFVLPKNLHVDPEPAAETHPKRRATCFSIHWLTWTIFFRNTTFTFEPFLVLEDFVGFRIPIQVHGAYIVLGIVKKRI